MAALTTGTYGQPPAEPEKCEHAWASKHQPGHRLYWVRQCMLCHEVDWDDLDTHIGGLTMTEPDPYEYRILRIPRDEDIDGAVVQLHVSDGGNIVTMDIRIPARDTAGDWTRDAMTEAHDHPGRIVTR